MSWSRYVPARKHVDPATYLRPDGYSGSSLAPAVMAANINTSVLDAEKTLDEIALEGIGGVGNRPLF